MIENESHQSVWNRFKAGDETALLALYNQHYLGLINYGRMIFDERDFVNDCLIDLLISFWQKKQSLPMVENVRSYLMTSLRRELIHKLEKEKKRNRKQRESQNTFSQHEISYEEYIVQLQTDKDLKVKISKALQQLTERQRQLIQLKFFDDLSYDEIANQCGITKRTAYNIIFDALKILKKALDDPSSGFTFSSEAIVLLLLATQL